MIQTGDPTGEQRSRAVVTFRLFIGYEVTCMPELVVMLKYHDASLELAE